MNKRIMIVDDEADILKALKVLFEHERYEVITVDSGKQCLNELEKGFTGVVLMDIMMPHMDGWDTIQTMVDRGLTNHVSIAIITGKGTTDHDKLLGLESYINDYIVKPVERDTLLRSVERCFSQLYGKTRKR